MGMPARAEVDKAVQKIATAVHGSGKRLSMQFAAIEDLPPQLASHRARGVNMTSILWVANSEYVGIDQLDAVLHTTAGMIPLHPCAICFF
jgi:hypothetical protein